MAEGGAHKNTPRRLRVGERWSFGLLRGMSLAATAGVLWWAALPPPAVAQSDPADRQAAVRLNFEGADIRQVIHTIAAALEIHYIIDPRVQGQVTVRTASDIPRDDLLPIFHQILRSSGVAAKRVGDIYHIVPVAEAKTKTSLSLSRQSRADDAFVIEIVKLEYAPAEEMAKVLQPFVSPGGDVLPYPRANLLVLSDLASSVRRLKEMVDIFDTDTFGQLHAEVYRIEHANVGDLGEELTGLLEPYGVITATGAIVTHGVFVIPLPRLNAVAVIAFNPEVFVHVEKWIQILDVPPEKGGGRSVHVYSVENAKAVDLAGILGELYGGGGTAGRRLGRNQGSGTRGSLRSRGNRSGSDESRRRGLGSDGESRRRDGGGLSGSGGTQSVLLAPQEGEKPVFKEEVRVVADEISNSLIILATPRDYAMIRDVLRRLDIVPRQVLIEAIIAEIQLIGTLAFGLEYALSQGGLEGLFGTSEDSGVVAAETPATASLVVGNSPLLATSKRTVNIGSQGVFGFLTDRDQFLALIQALETRQRVNVLATPYVIASDNREASILIGEEVPILTSTSTSTLTDNARTINSVQYRDTGRILTILPQINSAGLVNLEIRQEVSSVGQAEFGRTNSPSFVSREAETTVVVQDGESVVLGGIIADRIRRTRNGVPFLMDVPVLGRLFRVDGERTERTELIILITPRVIRSRQELQAVTEDFTRRIKTLKEMIDRRPPAASSSQPALPSPGNTG